MQRFFFTLLFSVFSFSLWAGNTGLIGFNSRQFAPSFDGSGIYNVYGSEISPHLKFSFGFFSDVETSSLKIVNPANRVTTKILDFAWNNNFLASMGLWDRGVVGMGIPVTFYQSGTNFNTRLGYSAATLGDIRLGGKYRFLESDREWLPDLAIVSFVSLPTGSRSHFSGDRGLGWENRLVLDKKIGSLELFGNIGYRLVDSVTVLSTLMDDQLTFGVGGRYTVPWKDQSWAIETEFFGNAVVKQSSESTTPMEWRGGIRKKVGKKFSVVAGLGTGVTGGLGSPGFRFFVGVQHEKPQMRKIPSSFALAERKLVHVVHFLFNQSDLTPRQQTFLDIAIKNMLSQGLPKKVVLYGHTDSFGEELYNLQLGRKRAESIKKILEESGFKDIEIIVQSFGDKKQIADNNTIQGQQKNRRVEIFVIF